MTPEALKVLDFVRERIATTGVAPTIVEIGEAVGLKGRGAIHEKVHALIDGGHLRCTGKGRYRNLRLPGVDLRNVPRVQTRSQPKGHGGSKAHG